MKKYIEPKLEVIELKNADVITTSGNSIASLFSDTGSYSSDRGVNLTSFRID